MTAPMTPARLEEIDAIMLEIHDTWTVGRALRDLRREIDRLRALPVLPTCGECRHIWGEGAAGHTCTHERGNEGPVSPRAAPPSWCPLRGGAR